jgi:hypothetical protein
MTIDVKSRPTDRRQFSAARMAAEALFAPSQGATTEDSATPPPQATVAFSPPATETRGPRVVRVERSPPVETAVTPGAADAREDEIDRPEVRSAPGRMRRLPRRKRRQLHGEVTVIRPGPATVGESLAPDSTYRTEVSERRLVEHKALTVRNGTVLAGTSPRYPALLARIRALQAEAQTAFRRESAEAVAWIRSAIKAYGIRADELGFPPTTTTNDKNVGRSASRTGARTARR